MIIYMGIVDGVNVVKLQGILTKFRPKMRFMWAQLLLIEINNPYRIHRTGIFTYMNG